MLIVSAAWDEKWDGQELFTTSLIYSLPCAGKWELCLPLNSSEFLLVWSDHMQHPVSCCRVPGHKENINTLEKVQWEATRVVKGQSSRCNEKWLREKDLYSPRKRRHRGSFSMPVLYTTCSIKAFQYHSKESFYKISKCSFFHKKNFDFALGMPSL